MGILELMVLLILAMLVLGALPTWPHSRNWGYYPSGGLVAVLLIVLLILLMRGSPFLAGPGIY